MSTSGSYPLVRHDAQIAVGVESTHGTSATPTDELGIVTDAGDMPDPEVEWQEERNIGNQGRQLSGKEPGRNVYEGGSLSVLPTNRLPFELLFGQEGVDGGSGTFTVEVYDGPLPLTATVEATYYGHDTDDDFVRTFAGNAVDSGTIQVDNESQLMVDLEFQAQGVTPSTTPTDVSPVSANPFLFHDADSFLSLHGTDYARLTNFEWEVSNNLDPKWYIQPNSPEDPYEIPYGNAAHSITADVTPVDDTLFQELIGRDDAGQASLSFTRPDGAQLAFEFREVGLESAPYPFPEEGTPDVSVSLLPNRGWVEHTPP